MVKNPSRSRDLEISTLGPGSVELSWGAQTLDLVGYEQKYPAYLGTISVTQLLEGLLT